MSSNLTAPTIFLIVAGLVRSEMVSSNMKAILIPFSLLGLVVTLSPLARANYIREQNGALTTDLSGVTITPAASAPGTEAWSITVDSAIYESFGTPNFLSEPDNEPGKVNVFDILPNFSFQWTSDVAITPGQDLPDPSGATFEWVPQNGDPFDVSFEDLGDAPVTAVPDAGSTFPLLGMSFLGLAWLARRRLKAAE